MKNIFDRMATEGESSSELLDDVESQLPDSEKSEADVSEDSPRTPLEVKEVTQELLRHGYIEEATRQDLFRRAIVHEQAIKAVLEPLDLVLKIDTERGIAFLAVAQSPSGNSSDEEAWSHPLVRRQRLTLEQSMLIAFLRQAFVIHEQEAGRGESHCRIAVEDLLPQFIVYFGDSGSDTKNESRLLGLLDQLKTYGVVSEVDKQHEVTIRPLIAHLANPESLDALLRLLKEQSETAKTQGGAE